MSTTANDHSTEHQPASPDHALSSSRQDTGHVTSATDAKPEIETTTNGDINGGTDPEIVHETNHYDTPEENGAKIRNAVKTTDNPTPNEASSVKDTDLNIQGAAAFDQDTLVTAINRLSTLGIPKYRDTQGLLPQQDSLFSKSGELEFDLSKQSARVKYFTEKGFQYNVDLVVTNFKKAVANHRRRITNYSKFLNGGSDDIQKLIEMRHKLESSVYEVSSSFHQVAELIPDKSNEYGEMLEECQESARLMLSRITESIRVVNNDKDSDRSSVTCDSKASGHSKHSSHKSKSSRGSSASKSSSVKSASSIKADAMAKAAAIRTKLKFVENEVQLKKLRMMRDLEVEEARVTAMNELECKSQTGIAVQYTKQPPIVDKSIVPNVIVSTQAASSSGFVTHSQGVNSLGNQGSHLRKPVVNSSGHNHAHNNPGNHVGHSNVVHTPLTVDDPVTGESHNPQLRMSLSDPLCDTGPQQTVLNSNAPEFHPSFYAMPDNNRNSNNLIPCESHGMEELFRNFGEFVSLSRLPVPEPGMFSGDPIDYPSWKCAFTSLIEIHKIPMAQRVYYLKRYLDGEAKRSVNSHLLIPSALSYQKAMQVLDRRFGDPFSIACAFKEKIENWPKISPQNYDGLREFSDFLSQVEVVARDNLSLHVLNDDTQNRIMLGKLPHWIVTRWARQVHKVRQGTLHYPSFAEFVCFLSTEADIACDPVTALPGRTHKKGTDHKSQGDAKEETGQRGRTLNTVQLHCIFCEKDGHGLDKCYKFQNIPMEDKQTYIKQKGICFGCLSKGHISKDCKRRLKCAHCNKSHPTVLHSDVNLNLKYQSDSSKANGVMQKSSDKIMPQPFDKAKSQSSENAQDTGQTVNKDKRATSNQVSSNQVSLFTSDRMVSKSTMVLPVYVTHCKSPGKQLLTYALLDTQSDVSFVSEDILQRLDVDGVDTTLFLSTMTSNNRALNCKKVRGLSVQGYNCDTIVNLPPVFSRDQIPANSDNIPTPQMAEHWPYLRPMVGQLMPKTDCGVGLLIGYHCTRALAPREVIPPVGYGPFAQRTDLGWGIVGLIDSRDVDDLTAGCNHVCSVESGSSIVLRTSAKEVISPTEIMRFFTREEGFQEQRGLSQDDVKFMKLMQQNIQRTKEGKYQMPLPIRDMSDLPPENKFVALRRLKSLVNQFKKKPEYHAQYKVFMNDLFSKNYAEPVPEEELQSNVKAHYLPHHGVYNVNKPGKVRVVMDASARSFGKSLNDCLLKGPDLLNSLLGVLFRFRKEHIAVTCDIEGMFQQFKVAPEHRNFLRFLWFADGDYNTDPIAYRSTVHLFGAASSPAVANFGLKRAATDLADKFEPQVVKFVQEEFYVDDGLVSVPSEEEAILLVKDGIKLCSQSGLRLHKFVSNSRRVLDSIDKNYKAEAIKNVNLQEDDLPIERALGVLWCVESDQLKFSVVVKPKAFTRRGVLSTVCSIFDPLGLIAPVVLQGKILLQAMCRDKLDWDEPLPQPLVSQWEKWLFELSSLNDLHVERCYKPLDFMSVRKMELHSFSDACTQGYGKCTYLRIVNADGRVCCSLVMGKARVAPLNAITIPRLELSAAVLAAESCQLVHKELQIEGLNCYFWSDSKIALGFINNEAKRFQVYVANRVQRIRDATRVEQWRYVPTSSNPADLASRGVTGKQLAQSCWFSGPKFLWEEDPFSFSDEEPVPVEELTAEMKASCFMSEASVDSQPLLGGLLSRYSNWNRLKRVLALCLKFIQNLKSKQRSSIDVVEVVTTEKMLIKYAQQVEFKDELHQLQSGHFVRLNSRLAKLDPFVDADGILRVGGRLKDASVPYDLRHPVVLPKNNAVTYLIVQHCHERAAHQGRGITMSSVRNKGYWVLGLSSVVSSLIFKCVFCRRHRAQVQGQKMSDLPTDRLESGPPFTHIAVDCFGPFYVTERRREIKRYGVLFTCMTSRAIHIETVNSMDSDSFINALRRVVSIRGPIRSLRCDQGSNFMGGIRQLKSHAQPVVDDKVKQYLLQNDCDFLVNAPHASHQGGVWERQIRSARSVLGSLLATEGKQLDDDGLRTLMYESANIVNSRPLTTTGDVTAPFPLSPNLLLTMKSNVVLPPPGEFSQADLYSRKRWRRVQYLANAFWERWKKEYIHQLQQRQKWHRPKRNFEIGDVILSIDEALPRSQWKLGRVTEVFTGSDSRVRKVKFVQGDPVYKGKSKPASLKSFERPVHKIVLILEADQTQT